MSRDSLRRAASLLMVVLLSLLLTGAMLSAEDVGDQQKNEDLFKTYCDRKQSDQDRLSALHSLLWVQKDKSAASGEERWNYCSRLLPFAMDETEAPPVRTAALVYHRETVTRFIPEYLTLARDKAPHVREVALNVIKQFGPEGIRRVDVEPLTALFTEVIVGKADGNCEDEWAAVRSLGLPVKTTLINDAIRNKDGSFCIGAIVLSGRPGNIAALPLLKECAEKAQEGTPRMAALLAMAQIGDVSVIPFLAQGIVSFRNQPQQFASEALALFGSAALDQIIPLLENGDQMVRYWAVLSLRNCRGDKARELLMNLCGKAGTRDQASASLALGNFCDPTCAEAIFTALSQVAGDNRYYTALALADCGDKRAIGTLVEMLDHPSANLREYAADRLRRLGEAESAEAMAKKLTPAGEPQVFNMCVLAALEDFRDEKAASVLVEQLGKYTAEMQQIAITRTLGKMGCKVAAPAVLDAFSKCPLSADNMPNLKILQAELAAACGRLGIAEAKGKLTEFAASRYPEVRAAALFALVLLGEKDRMKALLEMDPIPGLGGNPAAGDPGKDTPVRAFTGDQISNLVKYLSEIGGDPAFATVVRIARSDCDARGRATAILELGKRAIPANKALFEELLGDYNAYVRVCASYVLFKYYKTELRMDVVVEVVNDWYSAAGVMARKCVREAKGISFWLFLGE
ncbi:MAG: hypothetical protein WC712_00695 [Candidatus Brocadiia bacterium]